MVPFLRANIVAILMYCCVVCCAFSRLHRDPALWEEPEKFDAHRFLRKTEHGKRRHLYQFMAVRV